MSASAPYADTLSRAEITFAVHVAGFWGEKNSGKTIILAIMGSAKDNIEDFFPP